MWTHKTRSKRKQLKHTDRGESPGGDKEGDKMKEMLNYYGYETIEEFSEAVGMNPVDAKRLLVEMYEEDTAPLATY